VYLLVFQAYIKEMHGSRSKIPSKNFSSCSVERRDLIPALKGYQAHNLNITALKIHNSLDEHAEAIKK
jgi:hypothetical protein